MKKWLLLAAFLIAPAAVHAADAVTISTQTINSRRAIIAYTNVSDGTGESAVQKLNIAALPASFGSSVSSMKIARVWYNTFGMAVRVLFDHTTDDTALVLQGDGHFDFRDFGGLKDPASAGGTGSILFTTVGHTSGDTYSIVMEVTY